MSTKKKTVIITIIICGLLVICRLDTIQQNRYEELRTGYEYMEKENYSQANDIFSVYLESCDNRLYWKMLEMCNGKDSIYSYESVERALNLCKENM